MNKNYPNHICSPGKGWVSPVDKGSVVGGLRYRTGTLSTGTRDTSNSMILR